MIMRSVMAMLLIALASCNTFKHKTQSLSKKQEHYYEKLEALRQYIQLTEDRKDEELEHQQITQLEIIADSLWYWHPDSGLLSRPGMLKVRYKLKELERKHQTDSKTGTVIMLAEDSIVTESRIINEHQVNTKNKGTQINYWWLIGSGVLLFLIISRNRGRGFY